jgi:GNAT superfamily N-acetyltransferase
MVSKTDAKLPSPETWVDGRERWSTDLTSRTGYRFHVRPINPDDEQALGAFFTHVTPDDLRFRFLSAVRVVPHLQLIALSRMDHRRTENFLAIDPETELIIASAMIAADEALETAEVAIAIRADFKHRGISWTLLEHVAGYARARGFKSLESTESRDNHRAIELEQEMGFKMFPCPGEATLCIVRATFS